MTQGWTYLLVVREGLHGLQEKLRDCAEQSDRHAQSKVLLGQVKHAGTGCQLHIEGGGVVLHAQCHQLGHRREDRERTETERERGGSRTNIFMRGRSHTPPETTKWMMTHCNAGCKNSWMWMASADKRLENVGRQWAEGVGGSQ